VIVARGLTKRFGSTLAVDDVSFEVRPGAVVGFIGHNGAGKTTALRMLLGHVRPDAGTATVLGRPYRELERPLERVGVLFESGLHPGRTGRDHLRVSAAVAGLRPDADRVDSLLDLVGLLDVAGRRTGGYSQGMRQRLGLATALLADPEVLILDEPANGLDPEGIRWMRNLLRELAGQGRTVLLSSHQLAEVAQTVDHVIVLDRGVIVAESSLAELVRRAGTEVLVRAPQAEVLARELRGAGIASTMSGPQELRARDVPARVVSELAGAAGVPVWEVHAIEPSLEEVFFDLTRGRGVARTDPIGGGADSSGNEPRDDGLAAVEADLDEGLRATRERWTSPQVIAVVAPGGGSGGTTLAHLLAGTLAAGVPVRTIALALSSDHGRMARPVAQGESSPLCLTDLLGDLAALAAGPPMRLGLYASLARSGVRAVAGPRDAQELHALSGETVDALLDVLGRAAELVVLDVGEMAFDALGAVLRRVDRVVLLGAPEVSDSGLLDALEATRSDRSTLVLNRVETARVETFARNGGAAGHALIPHDEDLARAFEAGDLRQEALRPLTRVALKRLGLVVAQRLV
jgi:ABC-2 type transport system ATP-binding protein